MNARSASCGPRQIREAMAEVESIELPGCSNRMLTHSATPSRQTRLATKKPAFQPYVLAT